MKKKKITIEIDEKLFVKFSNRLKKLNNTKQGALEHFIKVYSK